jgi:hypothetical protein
MALVRLPTAVLTVLCVAALVIGPGPADAAPRPASASASSGDLPRRAMNDEVFRNNKGWLIFKGDVDPGWNNKHIQVYKRLCQGCSWELVKKVPTDGSGRWRTRIFAPETGYWYWKGVVPKAGNYGRSVTQTWRTYVA